MEGCWRSIHLGQNSGGLSRNPTIPVNGCRLRSRRFPFWSNREAELGFGQEKDTNARARRTVIAQDQAGRILFIVIPEAHFTLHELSLYLTESDLNLDIALNLDGGGSTGILVANPREIISPNTLLPFVILVYPR